MKVKAKRFFRGLGPDGILIATVFLGAAAMMVAYGSSFVAVGDKIAGGISIGLAVMFCVATFIVIPDAASIRRETQLEQRRLRRQQEEDEQKSRQHKNREKGKQ